MPDKQNENKFMAMLERRGMIRKAGSDTEFMETEPDNTNGRDRADADMRSVFNPPPGDTIPSIPTARQPVPGMINPVNAAERSAQLERELPRPTARAQVESAPPSERIDPEQFRRVETSKPSPFFSGLDYDNGAPVNGQPATPPSSKYVPVSHTPQNAAPPRPAQYTPGTQYTPSAAPAYERPSEPPPIENYTARYLDIEELYDALSLRSKRTDTIYLIEEYLRTLPESLPDESRREIVGKIVAASGFDFDLLIGDGVLRVKMLKEYAERFAKYTDDFVSARNAEVDDLEQQIMRIRRQVENRRDLHKKQFFAIEAEAQRLKDILTFISG